MKTAILLTTLLSVSACASTLTPRGVIDLPGEPGKRFDYLTVDPDHGYLFSAHLGAGLLYVIDLKTQRLLDTVSGVPGVEGVEYIPGQNKVYTSDWKDQTVGVVDLVSMKVTKKIPAQKKPDGSVYAAPFDKLYVSDEVAKAVIVIDVKTDAVVKTLYFQSETGMPQFDPIAKKVYVNLQDQNLIAEIDPSTDTVSAQYATPGCKGNHGMVLDTDNRRAFLACEGNDRLAVMDLNSHSIIQTLSLPSGVDVVKYDKGLKRIYAACYSGYISVIHEDDPNHFSKLEDHRVQAKVHSLEIDPVTHDVYAPEQEENGKPVARMIIYKAI